MAGGGPHLLDLLRLAVQGLPAPLQLRRRRDEVGQHALVLLVQLDDQRPAVALRETILQRVRPRGALATLDCLVRITAVSLGCPKCDSIQLPQINVMERSDDGRRERKGWEGGKSDGIEQINRCATDDDILGWPDHTQMCSVQPNFLASRPHGFCNRETVTSIHVLTSSEHTREWRAHTSTTRSKKWMRLERSKLSRFRVATLR